MNATRTSAAITTVSALVLAAGGMALLFGAEEILARAMPGTTAGSTVLGQLVAAGWLAIAGLNWNQRQTIIGGIYGRPLVLANFALYMVSAFSLAHPAMAGGARHAHSARSPCCSARLRCCTRCCCCAGRSVRSAKAIAAELRH